jgi:hypothetical protein
MDDKVQTPPVDKTTPEQIVQPEPKKENKTPIIIAAVLILILVGVSTIYFLSTQKKSGQQSNPQISQTPSITTPASPTSTANAPTKVVTVPLNAAEFVKDVVVEDSCNNPIGLVTYRDTENDTWMRINSLLDIQNKNSEDGLAQIEAYLKGSTALKPYQDINAWEFPFRNYCGGSTHMFVKELPGIVFPNTESSKAMIVYTTQSVHGQVTIVVLAKKGNDIIQLSKYMDDKSLYESSEKACPLSPDSKQEDYQQSENCYQDKMLQDTNLQSAAVNQAKALVSQFAIK